jgi:hypothetical protein
MGSEGSKMSGADAASASAANMNAGDVHIVVQRESDASVVVKKPSYAPEQQTLTRRRAHGSLLSGGSERSSDSESEDAHDAFQQQQQQQQQQQHDAEVIIDVSSFGGSDTHIFDEQVIEAMNGSRDSSVMDDLRTMFIRLSAETYIALDPPTDDAADYVRSRAESLGQDFATSFENSFATDTASEDAFDLEGRAGCAQESAQRVRDEGPLPYYPFVSVRNGEQLALLSQRLYVPANSLASQMHDRATLLFRANVSEALSSSASSLSDDPQNASNEINRERFEDIVERGIDFCSIPVHTFYVIKALNERHNEALRHLNALLDECAEAKNSDFHAPQKIKAKLELIRSYISENLSPRKEQERRPLPPFQDLSLNKIEPL